MSSITDMTSSIIHSLKLPLSEQRLVSFARDEFGEPLSQFLLIGLAETETARRWRLTIAFTDHGTARHRELELSVDGHPDSSLCLPRRREPLVMLALLHLFLQRDGGTSNSLEYDLLDVTERLGWKPTPASQRVVDAALWKHFNILYKWRLSAEELGRKEGAFYKSSESFVGGYASVDREVEAGCTERRVANRVDFNRDFIKHLKARSSFGVKWETVQSVTRHPQVKPR